MATLHFRSTPAGKALGYAEIMRLPLPESTLPVMVTLDPTAPMSADEFWEFCVSNPDLRFERSAAGEIIIVPPAGGETDYRSIEVAGELRNWSKRNRQGTAFGSTAAFILPSGAVYSPDAAWVSNERLQKLTAAERRKFLKVIPEFIAQVMSPTDRLKAAQAKMREWMENGVELAWLFDSGNKTVYIYRAGQAEPEQHKGGSTLAAEGSLQGFELDLDDIWDGLASL